MTQRNIVKKVKGYSPRTKILAYAFIVLIVWGVCVLAENDQDLLIDDGIVSDSTAITFNVINPHDSADAELVNATVYVYELDTSEYPTSKLVDIEDYINNFSLYTLESTSDWDDAEIEVEDMFYYLVEINLTGYSAVFMSSFISKDLGHPQVLMAGVNNVYLVDQAESWTVIANGINSGTGAVADTDETEWMISIIALDEDSERTNYEGYRTYTDFKTMTVNNIILAITFNVTAEDDWVELTSSGIETYDVNASVFYIELSNVMFSNQMTYSIEIDSGLGVDFELVNIAAGIGCIDDGLTTTFATVA
jgi:hypothetical protein